MEPRSEGFSSRIPQVLESSHDLQSLSRKVPLTTLRLWKKQNRIARQRGSGRTVICPELDEAIFEWFLECRGLGIVITDKIIQTQAANLCEEFLVQYLQDGRQAEHDELLTLIFSNGWLEKFKKRWKIVQRRIGSCRVHTFETLQKGVTVYFDELQKVIRRKNIRYFYNMDETSVFFDPGDKATLEIKGTRNVVAQSHNGPKKRCTVILSIGSSGEKLPVLIIIKVNKPKNYQKGQHPNPEIFQATNDEIREKIRQKEAMILLSYTAWNCNHIMSKYYVKYFYTHARHSEESLLIMDNFAAHFSDEVVDEEFTKFNVKTLSLAPNCTPVLQPLDVSVMRPFKQAVRAAYRDWILARSSAFKEANLPLSSKAPKDEFVISWILDAWDSIKTNVVIDSKIHTLTFTINNGRL